MITIVDLFMHIFAGFILVIAGFFCYMSAHCAEEQRKGKCIRLPWEKKRKVFDKSDIEYRDGDNT
jgi:hypothetical protein|tara:strand:- start:13374 stop:13568 length:195 start_codon:yes stop_codon:yes gene_type:complete